MSAARPLSPVVRHAAAQRPAQGGLSLYLYCHDFLLSLDTRWVDRLVLPEEAKGPLTGSPAIVEIGEVHHAVWNLGVLFRTPVEVASVILLRVETSLGSLGRAPLALAAGRLLKVGPTPAATPLPPGLFRERGGAIAGAFAGDTVAGGLSGASLGLVLDPTGLLDMSMQESSAHAVERARGRPT